MNIAVTVVTLLLVAGVLALVSAPLRRTRRGDPATAAEHRRAELEAAREAKYREIRDTELDFATGKLSEADYDRVRGALRAEAAAILRELEELGEL